MRRFFHILIVVFSCGLLGALLPAQAQDFQLDFYGSGLCRDHIGIGQISGAFGEGVLSESTNAGFGAPECLLSNTHLMLVFSPQIANITFLYSTRDNGRMHIQVLRGTKILNEATLSGEGRSRYDFTETIDRVIITETNGGRLYVDGFTFRLASGQALDAPWDPRDGRIAPHAGATINIFCDPARGLSVHSELARTSFIVPFDGAPPAQHTLLGERRGVRLYRLSDGPYQAMDIVNRDGRVEILIADVDNACHVQRWRRGYYYPTQNTTEYYAQSGGW